MLNKQHILIFDSGIGGLSIYNEIYKILPNYNYLYVFDNMFFPYSEKSKKFIIYNTLKIIKSVMNNYVLSLIIIACNTVSTIMLPLLRSLIDIQVVGVFPAIESAVSLTNNGVIGLLATKNTISCLYVKKLIKKFSVKYNFFLLGSTELVQIAQNKMYGLNISLDRIIFILRSFIDLVVLPDVLVLGCTHYPFLLSEFVKIFGNEVKFIDSSLSVANRVYSIVKNNVNFYSYVNPINEVLYLKKDIYLRNIFSLFNSYGFSKFKQFDF